MTKTGYGQPTTIASLFSNFFFISLKISRTFHHNAISTQPFTIPHLISKVSRQPQEPPLQQHLISFVYSRLVSSKLSTHKTSATLTKKSLQLFSRPFFVDILVDG